MESDKTSPDGRNRQSITFNGVHPTMLVCRIFSVLGDGDDDDDENEIQFNSFEW